MSNADVSQLVTTDLAGSGSPQCALTPEVLFIEDLVRVLRV